MAHGRLFALTLMLASGVALADEDPAINKLEKALPPGWSVLATDTELVIRHDRPCFVTDEHKDNAKPAQHVPAHTPDGRLVTLELRYKLETKWTKHQYEEAKLANARVAAELQAARAKYHVDAIHQVAGKPAPATADEKTRQAAFDGEAAKLAARQV